MRSTMKHVSVSKFLLVTLANGPKLLLIALKIEFSDQTSIGDEKNIQETYIRS